jgi:8-oxo-dGTP pyrophosphatase MutT (NUDIX family)
LTASKNTIYPFDARPVWKNGEYEAVIKKVGSRTVYKNKWMTVREDQIEYQNGASGIYGVVDKPDFVLIIPFDGDGVYLVNQYRYPVQYRFWEFPQGAWETEPNSEAAQVAKKELREETGLSADSWEYIGHAWEAYGFANQGMHVFLATELTMGKQELEAEEEGLVVKRFTLKELENLIRNGEMKDTSSLAAYTLWKLSLTSDST